MAPKRRIADTLTEDEKAIMLIAIRLHSALFRREQLRGKVIVDWYMECIKVELVRILHVWFCQRSHQDFTGRIGRY